MKNRKAIERYSTQAISELDKLKVKEALDSDFLTGGPLVREFEESLASTIESKHVISLNSGTAALQLAYRVANIKTGSLVWTSPITFVATANAAKLLGAEVDFVDIDEDTLNISPELLEHKLISAKKKNKIPDVITVVHFGGSPCDLDKIFSLAGKYNFKVLEDASHALGASYNKEKIGQNSYSFGSVFSFHPVKMITTGEGGALSLKSNSHYQRALSLRSHGIEYSPIIREKEMPGWYYEQKELGYNCRISEMQAALGVSQLKKLEEFVKIRNSLAKSYKRHLSPLPIKWQKLLDNCISSYHLFTIEIMDKNLKRDDLYNYLQENKIGCQVHYIPVHLQPYYQNQGYTYDGLKNAEAYYSRCLSLPLHQNLTNADIEFVCETIKKFFK